MALKKRAPPNPGQTANGQAGPSQQGSPPVQAKVALPQPGKKVALKATPRAAPPTSQVEATISQGPGDDELLDSILNEEPPKLAPQPQPQTQPQPHTQPKSNVPPKAPVKTPLTKTPLAKVPLAKAPLAAQPGAAPQQTQPTPDSYSQQPQSQGAAKMAKVPAKAGKQFQKTPVKAAPQKATGKVAGPPGPGPAGPRKLPPVARKAEAAPAPALTPRATPAPAPVPAAAPAQTQAPPSVAAPSSPLAAPEVEEADPFDMGFLEHIGGDGWGTPASAALGIDTSALSLNAGALDALELGDIPEINFDPPTKLQTDDDSLSVLDSVLQSTNVFEPETEPEAQPEPELLFAEVDPFLVSVSAPETDWQEATPGWPEASPAPATQVATPPSQVATPPSQVATPPTQIATPPTQASRPTQVATSPPPPAIKPKASPFDSDLPLEQEPWFHDNISGPEADDLLKNEPVGSYLVRLASQKPHYTICFVDRPGHITKTMMLNLGSGYKLSDENTVYPTPQKLMKAFEAVLRLPVWCLSKPTAHRVSTDLRLQQEDFSALMFATWKSMAEYVHGGTGSVEADLDNAISFLASMQ